MATAYKTPLAGHAASESEPQMKLRFWNRFVRLSIYGIILPLLFGVSSTVVAMLGAYDGLSETGAAAAAVDLSAALDASLRTTQLGVGVAVGAAICLVIGLKKRRALRRGNHRARRN